MGIKSNHLMRIWTIIVSIIIMVSFTLSDVHAAEYIRGNAGKNIALNRYYTGTSGDSSSNTPYLVFKTSGRKDSKYVITLTNKSEYALSVNLWDYNSEYGWGTIDWGRPAADAHNTTSTTFNAGSLKANKKYCLQVWSKGLSGNGKFGNFGIKVQEIIAKPGKATVTSTKVGKKKVTLKYKKLAKASRYQIQIKQKGGKWKTYNVKSTKKTIGKLKSKKIYYVRVRGQRQIGKKYYSGAWSTARKIRVR